MSLFSKNDWMPIEIRCSSYEKYTTYRGIDIGKPIRLATIFNIKYSKSRNKLRLEIDGDINEVTMDDHFYALERLTELNRLLLTNNISKILENKIS